jgi:hypothetical protein
MRIAHVRGSEGAPSRGDPRPASAWPQGVGHGRLIAASATPLAKVLETEYPHL